LLQVPFFRKCRFKKDLFFEVSRLIGRLFRLLIMVFGLFFAAGDRMALGSFWQQRPRRAAGPTGAASKVGLLDCFGVWSFSVIITTMKPAASLGQLK
jgi:hypothetical protein